MHFLRADLRNGNLRSASLRGHESQGPTSHRIEAEARPAACAKISQQNRSGSAAQRSTLSPGATWKLFMANSASRGPAGAELEAVVALSWCCAWTVLAKPRHNTTETITVFFISAEMWTHANGLKPPILSKPDPKPGAWRLRTRAIGGPLLFPLKVRY